MKKISVFAVVAILLFVSAGLSVAKESREERTEYDRSADGKLVVRKHIVIDKQVAVYYGIPDAVSTEKAIDFFKAGKGTHEETEVVKSVFNNFSIPVTRTDDVRKTVHTYSSKDGWKKDVSDSQKAWPDWIMTVVWVFAPAVFFLFGGILFRTKNDRYHKKEQHPKVYVSAFIIAIICAIIGACFGEATGGVVGLILGMFAGVFGNEFCMLGGALLGVSVGYMAGDQSFDMVVRYLTLMGAIFSSLYLINEMIGIAHDRFVEWRKEKRETENIMYDYRWRTNSTPCAKA